MPSFAFIREDGLKEESTCHYNIETVMAEKVETILSRGAFSTDQEIIMISIFLAPHSNMISQYLRRL